MAVPIVRVSGPLSDHVPGLKSDLLRQGYADHSCRQLLRLAGHLNQWLDEHGLGLGDLSDEQVDAFLRARRAEGYAAFLSQRGLVPIRRYLVEAGLVSAPSTAVSRTPTDELLIEYKGFLVGERGLTAKVVQDYLAMAQRFLSETFREVGLSLLDGAAVKQYVLERSRGCGQNQTRQTATGLRSFLSFLYLRGHIAADLRGAVPKIAGWHMASLPKYLAPERVSAIVESCDRRSTNGRRDYAVLLLLARMGLRAEEVASLSLDDMDWKEGLIFVRGKGGRQDRMPLSAEVGAAIASYLRRRRRTTCRALFLHNRAPYARLASGSISSIVRYACERAGVPRVGAHRLRHSAATTMLRGGATLDEVSQVLRHRHHATTAIYAKVDHNRLHELAQPWPGGAA